MQNSTNLIWIDMEMTGLRPETDRILEIATIITDKDLNILAEGPVYAVRQPQELLDGMSDWCKTHHSQSGLLARCESQGVTSAEYGIFYGGVDREGFNNPESRLRSLWDDEED